MIDFAGWELPVQYKSAVEEHHAVRRAVGVFDVSHMGQIEFKGSGALAQVQKVTCNDVGRIADGQAQYSAFLTPEGTFIDDIVLYRINTEHFLICVNAATKDKDFQWLRNHQEGSVDIYDCSEEYSQLAVQGPLSEKVVQSITNTNLSELKFYRFVWGEAAGARALIARTGYTGEDGFELYIPPSMSESVWHALFEAGARFNISPAGLAARNSLRLEMRYPLYGNDIDESRTPLEAGLGWIVKLDKDFIGKQALVSQREKGLDQKLIGFEMVDRGIARDGYPVFVDGERFGYATSAGFSPSLSRSIGLAYLPDQSAEVGKDFQIDIRGRLKAARVVQTPFYKRK
jgi:aminomethyltransferase